jgi:F-type H+-transporting ATPase subunit delta
MKANKKTRRLARNLYRLCVVGGVLDGTRARRVSRRLGSSARRGSLPVLTEFHRLVHLDHERHAAVVESATPLAAAVRDDILADLSRLYGPGLHTSFSENPRLVGGVRIKVGSDVYDGSLRGRLAALEARL